MDTDANKILLLRKWSHRETTRNIKVVLLNGSEMRAGRWNNRYSAAYYFLLL